MKSDTGVLTDGSDLDTGTGIESFLDPPSISVAAYRLELNIRKLADTFTLIYIVIIRNQPGAINLYYYLCGSPTRPA